jgi:hypothetical protein
MTTLVPNNVPLPATNATAEQWQAWVDCHVPYRGMADASVPRELHHLAGCHDREMAALTAQFCFSALAKKRARVPRPMAPQNAGGHR